MTDTHGNAMAEAHEDMVSTNDKVVGARAAGTPGAQVPLVTLNNGVEMPQEGFGVFQVRDLDVCRRAVLEALEVGYRSIDTAQGYDNEEAVGAALAESPVDRSDVFVTTKVWIDNFGDGVTRASVEESMRRLGCDYLDLVLIHQPFGDYYGAWRDLEALLDEGRVRAIGVSNLWPNRYLDLATYNRVVPAVNQLEMHVFQQQREARRWLDRNDTRIEAWSPLAEGRNGLFDNPTLTRIGEAHDKTAAQVALRFLTQEGAIIIPKSVHVERMRENLDIWDFALTEGEMTELRSLDLARPLFRDHDDPQSVLDLAPKK